MIISKEIYKKRNEIKILYKKKQVFLIFKEKASQINLNVKETICMNKMEDSEYHR